MNNDSDVLLALDSMLKLGWLDIESIQQPDNLDLTLEIKVNLKHILKSITSMNRKVLTNLLKDSQRNSIFPAKEDPNEFLQNIIFTIIPDTTSFTLRPVLKTKVIIDGYAEL